MARDPQLGRNIINNATVLYLSGLAVAIGFRMNLFNIGVDGQYRSPRSPPPSSAGEAWLPGSCNIVLAILVAMAGRRVVGRHRRRPQVTRGVSEVISTIMLNAIATCLVAYLLRQVGGARGGQQQRSAPSEIPEGSRSPASR